MSVLYRKYRPEKFDDVVGQSNVTEALKNQIIKGRIGHAYLFTGSRGTGKTTCAKIFARAINCLSPVNGSPCGKCEACRELKSADCVDIIEMDAASNNGVDEIREIREKVKYAPAVAKKKVYIIDEAHMLTAGAFNALLKTLEEPPEHVVFILATTEPQRLPATILSRCQRFDFGRIPAEQIVGRLREAAAGAGGTATDQALHVIARAAEALGWAEEPCAARICAALRRHGLPTGTEYAPAALAQAALADKKRRGGSISLVVPRKIGKCEMVTVPVGELERIFAAGWEDR